MTSPQNGHCPAPLLEEIEVLKEQIERDPTDWVAKMRLAEAFTQRARTIEARRLYQEIVAGDPGGVFTARKKAESRATPATGVGENGQLNRSVPGKSPVRSPQSPIPNFLRQWFYHLPVRRKLLLVLLGAKLVSVSALVGVSAWVCVAGTQQQVLRQVEAQAEAFAQNTANQKLMVAVSSGKNNSKALPEPGAMAAGAGSYTAVYLHGETGKFILASSRERVKDTIRSGVTLPNQDLLNKALTANGEIVTGWVNIESRPYAIAALALPDAAGAPKPVLVLGATYSEINAVLGTSLAALLGVTVLVLAADLLLARLLVKAIAEPVEQLQKSARLFAGGERSARAPVLGGDECGHLAVTFNQLLDELTASTAALEEEARLRQAETALYLREKERLQQEVSQLLLDIAGAVPGDLTVRSLSGSPADLADSFTATIESLREIVTRRVQSRGVSRNAPTFQMRSRACNSSPEVEKLFRDCQAEALATALDSVAEMNRSMQSVASATLKAASVASQALMAAKEGEKTINQTVSSVSKLRESLAGAKAVVKRLAESEQEISKIVSTIVGISERTHLLAFNVSIAAARAGSGGQVFRLVADEVQRLAERVRAETVEIEQLVSAIQQGTLEALQTVEESTSQVETGTELLAKTKLSLRRLAGMSHKTNQLLQSISASTVSQAQASARVVSIPFPGFSYRKS